MASAAGQVTKAKQGRQLVFQATWHAPAQVVVVEAQLLQFGQAAQLRRELSAQAVPGEEQLSQVGEVA